MGHTLHATFECHLHLGQGIYGSTYRGETARCEKEICCQEGVSEGSIGVRSIILLRQVAPTQGTIPEFDSSIELLALYFSSLR